ncbi:MULTISPECIES: Mini-ribonuclease 3 [unclassified Butyrivibrio]|uniref:Mini-ribonuclease 3 n=1 Tax=unclassified Butyrivibrio TaxID=2639466 RepID=UPI0003B78388|nr:MULTISPECIES: ribonuclease III domain-containing protein [unclassified Butyrivibrio]
MDNNIDLAAIIRENFAVPGEPMNRYSPLALAFMGDSVYEIIIRSIVVQEANRPAGQLNKIKVKYVNAAAQAKIIEFLEPDLTEEELDAYKRGRNAKSYTSAKNQSVTDYRKATGLEALCGYLYLKGDLDRLIELLKKGIEVIDR